MALNQLYSNQMSLSGGPCSLRVPDLPLWGLSRVIHQLGPYLSLLHLGVNIHGKSDRFYRSDLG